MKISGLKKRFKWRQCNSETKVYRQKQPPWNMNWGNCKIGWRPGEDFSTWEGGGSYFLYANEHQYKITKSVSQPCGHYWMKAQDHTKSCVNSWNMLKPCSCSGLEWYFQRSYQWTEGATRLKQKKYEKLSTFRAGLQSIFW